MRPRKHELHQVVAARRARAVVERPPRAVQALDRTISHEILRRPRRLELAQRFVELGRVLDAPFETCVKVMLSRETFASLHAIEQIR